ncbi:MAG TPA: hypothetical protein VHW74_02300 [Mycobacteriales bacterium]|jgi:hypothetical protein|nr:hypothetical protein [Mycobacteriales bacterium]
MRLTYLGVGPFTPLNVSVAIGSITAHPAWDACQDLIGSCSSVGLTGLANSIGSWTPEVWSVAVHGKDLSWCVAGTLPWRAGVRPSADTLSTLYDLGLTRRGGLTS